MRLLTRLAVVLALVLLPMPAGSAQPPDTARGASQVTDERGDAAPEFDVTQMVGYDRYEGLVVVQLYGPQLRVGRRLNGAFVYLDVAGDTRPDYRVSLYLPGDGDGARGLGIARVRDWDGEGRRFACRGLTGRWRERASLVEVHVPRACIGRPRRVRINGELWNFNRYDRTGRPVYGSFDAVPDHRRFPRRPV